MLYVNNLNKKKDKKTIGKHRDCNLVDPWGLLEIHSAKLLIPKHGICPSIHSGLAGNYTIYGLFIVH